ncbi:MAG: hypothetical protein JWQ89_3396 [Devosia sp.]|uniref:YoaK family protein n=1 Tax=Devosia sp. TaxID=1871048 RepID=UPI002633E439|nr:DUF1275 family protein [Devosia sp.]MDB5541669.1 hypothetical protein [Devosia sp.]
MTPAPQLSLGLALTAAAGMIDVVGFIELGGFYTSFMSGNTTQLGAGIADLGPTLALPAGLIIMFVVGSFLGSIITGPDDRRRTMGVLALVLFGLAVTLALSVLGFTAAQAMLALATAAGAQNAILVQRGAARLGTTFVTGTLFAVGQDLARTVRGEAPPLRWVQHLLVWLALLLGALGGAIAYGAWHVWALLLPAAVYLVFLIGFAARRSHD